MVDEITPKVESTYADSIGHGIAYLDIISFVTLELVEGDIVELQGKRKSVARCKPIGHSEEYLPTLRIDGITRNNIGVEIGDVIKVKKITAIPAIEITVKPLEHDDEQLAKLTKISSQYLVDNLDGVPVIHADNVAVKFDDQWFAYGVIETYPTNHPVVINKNTIFHIVDYVSLLNEDEKFDGVNP